MRASISRRIDIPGPSGPLQAIVEDTGALASAFAIICHPHPLHGGTMDNKVVVSVARALQEQGVSTVRFNFRGVGTSAGSYGGGEGETADALAVTDWAHARWPQLPLVSAGFSFGTFVALRLALARRTRQLILVAPAVSHFDFAALADPDCPWLVVQGEDDEVVPADQVLNWVRSRSQPPAVVLLPGAGHFFHGKLIELKAAVTEGIRSDGRRSGG